MYIVDACDCANGVVYCSCIYWFVITIDIVYMIKPCLLMQGFFRRYRWNID